MTGAAGTTASRTPTGMTEYLIPFAGKRARRWRCSSRPVLVPSLETRVDGSNVRVRREKQPCRSRIVESYGLYRRLTHDTDYPYVDSAGTDVVEDVPDPVPGPCDCDPRCCYRVDGGENRGFGVGPARGELRDFESAGSVDLVGPTAPTASQSGQPPTRSARAVGEALEARAVRTTPHLVTERSSDPSRCGDGRRKRRDRQVRPVASVLPEVGRLGCRIQKGKGDEPDREQARKTAGENRGEHEDHDQDERRHVAEWSQV